MPTNNLQLQFLEQGNVNTSTLYNENLVIVELFANRVLAGDVTSLTTIPGINQLYRVNNVGDANHNNLVIQINTNTVKVVQPFIGLNVFNSTTNITWNGTEWLNKASTQTETVSVNAATVDFDFFADVNLASVTATDACTVRFYYSDADRTSETQPAANVSSVKGSYEITIAANETINFVDQPHLVGNPVVKARAYQTAGAVTLTLTYTRN